MILGRTVNIKGTVNASSSVSPLKDVTIKSFDYESSKCIKQNKKILFKNLLFLLVVSIPKWFVHFLLQRKCRYYQNSKLVKPEKRFITFHIVDQVNVSRTRMGIRHVSLKFEENLQLRTTQLHTTQLHTT